jgi:phosphoglycolate phosphatase-like HAD superfamily hydrolase
VQRSITPTVEPSHYVIFDLDDTLVHSDAVREAFEIAGEEFGISYRVMMRTLDALPGRPAREIFEALGLDDIQATTATDLFLGALDALNIYAPPRPYPDAETTLRALAANGAQLMLSTGSSPERAHRVLEHEGWDTFAVVLGSDADCSKGTAHYDRFAKAAPDPAWTRRAITIGDSPQDMRLGAEHGVPIRIGIDRDGDPLALFAAGATHVVRALAEVMPIVAKAPVWV